MALPTEDTLNLRLSVPPSFRDPKSVVVIALPAVGPARMPPLHPIDPKQAFCAQKPDLILPAEGAPLVLATQLAHDLVLHVGLKSGSVDIPLKAVPGEGGLVLDHPAPLFQAGEVTGEVRGKWGFDDWIGPAYRLHSAQQSKWSVESSDQSALVVGREDTLHLKGEDSLCIDKVEELTTGGNALPLTWKSPKPDLLVVSMPMAEAVPGPVQVEIRQFGLEKPDVLTLNAYAEAASLDRLSLNAGDPEAVLTGTRLDEVAKVTLKGVAWSPATLGRVQDIDQPHDAHRQLDCGPRSGPALLRHGAASRRPRIESSRDRQPRAPPDRPVEQRHAGPAVETPSVVQLGSQDDLPVEKRLVFFLKSKVPSQLSAR